MELQRELGPQIVVSVGAAGMFYTSKDGEIVGSSAESLTAASQCDPDFGHAQRGVPTATVSCEATPLQHSPEAVGCTCHVPASGINTRDESCLILTPTHERPSLPAAKPRVVVMQRSIVHGPERAARFHESWPMTLRGLIQTRVDSSSTSLVRSPTPRGLDSATQVIWRLDGAYASYCVG